MSTFRCEVVPVTLLPHPNADSLSLVQVFGFTCVVRTADWVGRDRGVYVPVDAVVPDRPEFAFLDGHRRIKARRLRGVFSMGLLLPAPWDAEVGDDLTEALGVTKYEPPEESALSTGGEDAVARAITNAIERGDDITYERERQIEQAVKFVAWLARKDREYLQMAPTFPKVYESGVRYDAALNGESLYDIPTILANPSDYVANIKSLVAWRCAELWQQGIEASPHVKWRDREGGGHIYTMVVKLPNGTEEDVIAKLRDDESSSRL